MLHDLNRLMKKTFFIFMCAVLTSCAGTARDVQLPLPDKSRGASLMQALSQRQSVREFSDRQLSEQDLADLLWAALGRNRDNGKLTAPTAMNKQEIRLFVFTKDGVAEYMPQTHSLRDVADGDHREKVAGRQDFVKTAPVSLVMVADMDKFGSDDERARVMASVDAGIVCQNINLFCAAVGMSTVPRASMDTKAIQTVLGLTDKQIPIMNNPVGYRK